jgi:hypothetical protein
MCAFYIFEQFVGYVRSVVFVSKPWTLTIERDVDITCRDVTNSLLGTDTNLTTLTVN